MQISRNKIQEISMILVYDALTYIHMNQEFNIERIVSNQLDQPYELVDPFLKTCVVKTLINMDAIINEIQPHMISWKFERINRLAQAILLQSVTQYRYIEQIDKKIVIENAVRLSKKYLDEGDYKLINAVLDAVL